MKILLNFLVFFLISSLAKADTIPLFTEINFPGGQKDSLQLAVDQLREIAFQYSDELQTGDNYNVDLLFEEYHSALVQLNPQIAGSLASSIYQALLHQSKRFILQKATKSHRATYNFLIYQAKNWGAQLPPEIDKWKDSVLLHSISFEAESLDFNAYNVDDQIKLLNDPKLGFELLMAILHVYQFQFYYAEYKPTVGNNFSQLIKKLLLEYELTTERESKILKLSYNMKDLKILNWYKKAKIQLNTPLLYGPSLFCFNVITLISQHEKEPNYTTEAIVYEKIKKFLNFGASFRATCIGKSLEDELIKWKREKPQLGTFLDNILSLEDDFSFKHQKDQLNLL